MRNIPGITIEVHYENSRGLPSVYNESLTFPAKADVLIFMHDDIWLDDPEWLSKVLVAVTHCDVIGVAGNTRISKNQPSWTHLKIENGKFVLDNGYCSGTVSHGHIPKGSPNFYGPTPALCELLDGVFIAVRSSYVLESQVRFDDRFTFDFYDMDFCRTARKAGLSLGTWPIALTHQSIGNFGTQRWQDSYAKYLEKWGS